MVGMDGLRDDDNAAPLAALWTSRLALFLTALLITTLFLHRVFSLPTGVMLNLVMLVMLGAAGVLLLGILGAVHIWRRGSPGASRIVVGGVVAGMLLSWPLIHLPTIQRLPEINDVTTDIENPPRFDTLADIRPADANRPDYPGADFAAKQREAYPDLKTLLINRPVEETYEIAAEALRRQRLTIANEKVPEGDGQATGYIEAVDRTLVMGFYDDVIVRIVGNRATARLDVRSASRYGRHDLGRNAARIRRILTEVVARLEATVPSRQP